VTEETTPRGRRPRQVAAVLVSLALLAVALVASLAVGAVPLTAAQVIHALLHGGRSVPTIIVRQIRLPRTELGIMVGASLATSGALMQALTGNPLADSSLLGISGGASFAIVLATYLGAISLSGLVWYSLAGAAVATVIVELLSRSRRRRDVLQLVLSGAVLASLLGAAISVVLLIGPNSLASFFEYQAGSLTGRPSDTFALTAPFAAVGLIIGLTRGPALNAIGLGEDVARALGVRAERQEVLVVVAVTLLAGSAVAAAGPIGFLGFAVPYLVRMAVGPDNRWVLPLSALGGASLLLLCDTVARVVVPGELPVGIATAAIGAPILIIAARTARVVRP
jgi:iron complex transport system permease protein